MNPKFQVTLCLEWVKRGVSQEIPNKISLNKEELKNLLEDHDTEENTSLNEDSNNQEVEDEEDGLTKYALDNYDEDDEHFSALRGLVCFPTNDDDPYMLNDETDESDIEDVKIRPDDNLVCIGVKRNDDYSIKFFVYNENDDDFFMHHDIFLSAPPLCLEWVGYDTEKPNLGNYLAVGGFSTVIDIWDIDIVDSLEPAFSLGSSTKKHKKKSSSKSGHTDAILSLAWNSYIQNILVSGSVDNSAVVWDMSCGKVLNSLKYFSEKVQSLKWHPFEPHRLLTGSCDEYVRLIDYREPEKVMKTWKCDGEVENVVWDHFSPFNCMASTNKGFVTCHDVRGGDKALWTLSAHTEACTGLALSCQCPGFLVTSSVDKNVKIWDVLDNKPSFVHGIKLKLGKLICISSSPDSPFVACVGGECKGESFKLLNLMNYPPVQRRFEGRELSRPTFTNSNEDDPISMEEDCGASSSAPTSSHKERKSKTKKLKR